MNYLVPLFLYFVFFIFIVYKYKKNIAIDGVIPKRSLSEGFATAEDQCIDEDNTVRKLTTDGTNIIIIFTLFS